MEASQKHGIYLLLPSGFREAIDISATPKIFLLENDPNGECIHFRIKSTLMKTTELIEDLSKVKEWLIRRVSILFTSGDIPTVKQGVKNGKPIISLPLICE